MVTEQGVMHSIWTGTREPIIFISTGVGAEQDNGYFYLDNLDPGGDNFTNGQDAMVNLYPDTINNTYPSYCTGQHVLNALQGTFEDGSGPLDNYQNNDNCSWLINPQSISDSIIKITISFDRFNTEAGNDVVKIYKGASTSDSLVASYSGDSIPPSVTVNSGEALVTFTTNGTNREPRLVYFIYEPIL